MFLCSAFPPQCRGVYNEPSLCCNCNSLTSHLPSCTVSLWGGPARSSPLYHYGFEAGTASLRLRRCCLQLRRGHAVRAALAVGALRAPTAIRTFWSLVYGLLRAIACTAAEQAHWTVPTLRIGDFGRLARADCAGRALGDVGDAIAHGRCSASMLHYAMRIGHIGVTSFITNPGGKACRRPRKV